MNNEGKFKKSLSDLVNSREFEFDEANWEKASAMIDSSRGSKGWNSPFVLVSSLLLVVAGITGAYLLYPSDTQELVVKSTIQKTAIEISQPKTRTVITAESKVVVRPEKEKLQNAEKKPAVTREPRSQNASPVTEIKKSAPDNVSKEPVLNTISEPTIAKSSPVQTIDKNTSKVSKPVAESSEEIVKSETETKMDPLAITASEMSKEELTLVGAIATNNSQVSPENKKVEGTRPEEKTVSEPLALVVKEESASPGMPLNAYAVSDNKDTPKMPVLETKEEKTQVVANAQTQQTEIKLSPEVPERTASEPPKGVGIYPLMPQADSAMLENDNATKLTYDIKEKPVIFSIEAGVSYLYGWKNPGETDANGYNPFVGVNFFQTAYDRLSVSLGLQYTSISNLNYSSHTTKVSQLGLGEESTVTVFTPTKIHYLVAPLRVHYRLNRKNIAGLGCNFAYLLTVESDVETYHQTATSTDGNTIYKDKGYTQGFRPFDVQLSAFYRHRLLSNISFNAEIFYGLVDAKDNTFFHSNVFERNTGLKISLVYNIQKK